MKSISYGCNYLDAYSLVDAIKIIAPHDNQITWNLANANDLDKDTVKYIISLALLEIEKHINPIKFKYINSFSKADVKMVFTPKNQKIDFIDEDNVPVHLDSPFNFDGQLGTLAIGFYPIEGDFRGLLIFDEDENWSNRHNFETGEIDLQTVALHEVLHVLGLKHSKVKKAAMYAEYSGEKRAMHQDDIDGIRDIYKDYIFGYVKPKKNIFKIIIDFLKNLFNIK